MLALRLPKHIEESLENLARKTGRTKSYYARKAIVEMIEDITDAANAEAILKEGGRRYSMDEFRAEFPEAFEN